MARLVNMPPDGTYQQPGQRPDNKGESKAMLMQIFHTLLIRAAGFSKGGALSDTLGHKSVIDKQRWDCTTAPNIKQQCNIRS